jgi:hypothetical protein
MNENQPTKTQQDARKDLWQDFWRDFWQDLRQNLWQKLPQEIQQETWQKLSPETQQYIWQELLYQQGKLELSEDEWKNWWDTHLNGSQHISMPSTNTDETNPAKTRPKTWLELQQSLPEEIQQEIWQALPKKIRDKIWDLHKLLKDLPENEIKQKETWNNNNACKQKEEETKVLRMENPTLTLHLPQPITLKTCEETTKKITEFLNNHPQLDTKNTTLWLEGTSDDHKSVEKILSILKIPPVGTLTAILSGNGEGATASLLIAADHAIALDNTSINLHTRHDPWQTKSLACAATRIARKLLEILTENIQKNPSYRLNLQNIPPPELPDNLSPPNKHLKHSIKDSLHNLQQTEQQLETNWEHSLPHILKNLKETTPHPDTLPRACDNLLFVLPAMTWQLHTIKQINQTPPPDWLTQKIQTLNADPCAHPDKQKKNKGIIDKLCTDTWQTALLTSIHLHTHIHNKKIKLPAQDALTLGLIDAIIPS